MLPRVIVLQIGAIAQNDVGFLGLNPLDLHREPESGHFLTDLDAVGLETAADQGERAASVQVPQIVSEFDITGRRQDKGTGRDSGALEAGSHADLADIGVGAAHRQREDVGIGFSESGPGEGAITAEQIGLDRHASEIAGQTGVDHGVGAIGPVGAARGHAEITQHRSAGGPGDAGDPGPFELLIKAAARDRGVNEQALAGLVLVDGFSVGDVQDVVIRDRQMLAQDGIFIIFGIINISNGKLKKSPDIISRGFVYLRESQDLLHEVRILIKDTIEKSTRGQNPINVDFVKDNITDAVSKFLLTKTAKRPMVIPVILTI